VKRLLLIGSALLTALMLSVLTWLFTSESGLLWAYREAQSRLPGVLSVEDISGRLAGLVRLEGVRYEDRGQAFKAGQVTVNWDPWALIKAEEHSRFHYLSLRMFPICLNQIRLFR
jgi:translocation and assembly module TamB